MSIYKGKCKSNVEEKRILFSCLYFMKSLHGMSSFRNHNAARMTHDEVSLLDGSFVGEESLNDSREPRGLFDVHHVLLASIFSNDFVAEALVFNMAIRALLHNTLLL